MTNKFMITTALGAVLAFAYGVAQLTQDLKAIFTKETGALVFRAAMNNGGYQSQDNSTDDNARPTQLLQRRAHAHGALELPKAYPRQVAVHGRSQLAPNP